jgi:hypothetical protein
MHSRKSQTSNFKQQVILGRADLLIYCHKTLVERLTVKYELRLEFRGKVSSPKRTHEREVAFNLSVKIIPAATKVENAVKY